MYLRNCLSFLIILTCFSCSQSQPEKIELNKDACYHCKMTISDLSFATEAITKKGRVFKFDDIACMLEYIKSNTVTENQYWIGSFINKGEFIQADSAVFFYTEKLNSPMRGNIAAVNNWDISQIPYDTSEYKRYAWKDLVK